MQDVDPNETSAMPTAPAPTQPAAVESRNGNLPLVPVLGGIAILLLALWVGLTVRPGVFTIGKNDPQVDSMKAELSAAESELNALRISMGLRPKESIFEPIEDVADRMRKDADTMVALAKTLQSSLAEKEAIISAKNTEIIELEKTRQLLVADLESTRSQLGGLLGSAASVDRLKAENQVLQTRIEALMTEAAQLKDALAQKPAGMPAEDAARWQSRLDEANRAKEFLEARLAQMEQELSKASLFAKSENELLPAAVKLFRALRKLEGKTESQIDAEYTALGTSLGASVLHMLSFETGSSELSVADQERIRAIVSEVPDGDMVLFVGYASETGDVYKNQNLSSARATTAAELFSDIKRSGQVVQAVYLGQTTRFSSEIYERNQIVEVWRIRIQ